MGYDNTLDKKIGITLVATGFEHKDPFAKSPVNTKAVPQEEKIVMTLQTEQPAPMPAITFVEPVVEAVVEDVAPVVEVAPVIEAAAPIVAPAASVVEAPSMQALVQQTLPLEQNDPLMMRPTFTAPVVEEEVYVAPVAAYVAPEVYIAPVEDTAPVVEERFVLQFELSPEITEEVVLPEVEPEKLAPPPPIVGVVNEGLVANTFAPEPVSSVNNAARFAEDGVARKVAAPVARPEIPVATGRPVAFVKVAEDGVPRAPPE
jgi:cell division protein FtsZ